MGWEIWTLLYAWHWWSINGILVLHLFGFSQGFWKYFTITYHKWILILCSKYFLGKIIFHRWFFHVLLQIFIRGIITRKGEWLIKYHYSPTGISGLIKSDIFLHNRLTHTSSVKQHLKLSMHILIHVHMFFHHFSNNKPRAKFWSRKPSRVILTRVFSNKCSTSLSATRQ